MKISNSSEYIHVKCNAQNHDFSINERSYLSRWPPGPQTSPDWKLDKTSPETRAASSPEQTLIDKDPKHHNRKRNWKHQQRGEIKSPTFICRCVLLQDSLQVIQIHRNRLKNLIHILVSPKTFGSFWETHPGQIPIITLESSSTQVSLVLSILDPHFGSDVVYITIGSLQIT